MRKWRWRWQLREGRIQRSEVVARAVVSSDASNRFDAALAAELGADPETMDGIVAFFGSDLGQRILGLEMCTKLMPLGIKLTP